MQQNSYVLTISCPDRVGIVAKVSTFLAENDCMIAEANHHADRHTGQFFMRNEITDIQMDETAFREAFSKIADEFDMKWQLTASSLKKRVLIMVSKQDHCLADLLYRWSSGEIDCEIPCVISNHLDMKGLVEWYGIPYLHIPVTPENKPQVFDEVVNWVDHYQADTIVLARYMQIIPPALCQKYPGQIINIHHSFLPSFIGAKPYHQAYERGVKLIGATCHYVTEDLDAGPIIEQDVARVSHSESAEEMVVLGKDVEKNVLARGLKYHLQDRVLVYGNKTVVFA
ncbi:formyltetrahydrofolate deformylase [Hydrogenovibrio thermophilus]|jgi:formyltetrahydrofolate deformylase|uniref:Formyltetrahydrofolate deformylase n=1 Tax=Hydrogenovibrio thermophilus TaxID=265883 RepID=A0A410H541_9GAMM|nr:formyltetrahydrofolate deformylase [Hydrogenovibrio thermophilus]QAB16029.1 formyltetrahydrofolate deformylase [Hydrogenovibrio thermophilus]